MTTVSVGISAVGLLPFGAPVALAPAAPGRSGEAFADPVGQVLDVLRSPVLQIGLLVAVTFVMVVGVIVTERVLSRRVRWLVLPSQEFDPTEEDVVRFGSALRRCVKRGPTGRLGRSGCAVRVRLASAGSGRMSYELEVPDHAVSVVRSAVYSGVVLDDPDRVDLEVVSGLPASPEEGAGVPPSLTSPERLEWAHSVDGGDVDEDWTHDPDPGAPGSRR